MSEQDSFSRTNQKLFDLHNQDIPSEYKADLIKLILQDHDNRERIENEFRESIWAAEDANSNLLITSVLNYGLNALRTAGLVSGAALAAVTGLLPGIERVLDHDVSPSTMRLIAALFSISLVISVIASGAAYFAQFFYSESAKGYTKVWKFPYIKPNPKQKRLEKIGIGFHWITAGLVLTSYCILGAGFFSLLYYV